MTAPALWARIRTIASVRVVVALGVFAAACSGTPQPLLPVTLPDLSSSDAAVQQQARELHATLEAKLEEPGTPPLQLSEAFGDLGMFLHAAEAVEAAEPYYRNAETLDPEDVRWPYYLGHLYRSLGRTAQAIASFERALALRPDDPATLVWLGRIQLELGRADQAERHFTRARTVSPQSVAVLAGLGQTALARDDYAGAVTHLERALELDPEALALHSPLAMAYRGLGDLQRADAHLKQWRNRGIDLADPLREELDTVLESGLSYELRGGRALEANDWPSAIELFARGVELTSGTTPLGRSLRHKLGTALAMNGDVRAAVERFEEVIALAPAGGLDEPTARAHYSLGLLMISDGRVPEAIERLTAALRYNPNYAEAHMALADTLRQAGRVEASLHHYREAVRIAPRDAAYARLGYGIALTSLGRYREARDWLEEAVRLHPEHPDLADGLDRVLAASAAAGVTAAAPQP